MTHFCRRGDCSARVIFRDALLAHASVPEARASIRRYLCVAYSIHNRGRLHSSLDGSASDQAYFNLRSLEAAAA